MMLYIHDNESTLTPLLDIYSYSVFETMSIFLATVLMVCGASYGFCVSRTKQLMTENDVSQCKEVGSKRRRSKHDPIVLLKQEPKPADPQQICKKADAAAGQVADHQHSSESDPCTKTKRPKGRSTKTTSRQSSKIPNVPKLAKRLPTVPTSQLIGVRKKVSLEENMKSQPDKNEQRLKKIEDVRRTLHGSKFTCSDFGDISTNAEESRQATNQRRKRKTLRTVSSSGTMTPRQRKLSPTRVGNKYTVEIDRDGGILKLTDATLLFPPFSVRTKIQLNIALCRNQKRRREDKNAAFETHALHMWLDNSSQSDIFLFDEPVTIRLVKRNSDKSDSIEKQNLVQRTASIKDLSWEFCTNISNSGGNCMTFQTTNLGGYRVISLRNTCMLDLHYQISVMRRADTDNPDQYIFTVKFYTDNMHKSVLDEATCLHGLEVLQTELIQVRAESSLQLSLSGDGLQETIAMFTVPKLQPKIKKSTSLKLSKSSFVSQENQHQRLCFRISSPFSSAECSLYFKWEQRLIPIPMNVNVTGAYAIGIQCNNQHC